MFTAEEEPRRTVRSGYAKSLATAPAQLQSDRASLARHHTPSRDDPPQSNFTLIATLIKNRELQNDECFELLLTLTSFPPVKKGLAFHLNGAVRSIHMVDDSWRELAICMYGRVTIDVV